MFLSNGPCFEYIPSCIPVAKTLLALMRSAERKDASHDAQNDSVCRNGHKALAIRAGSDILYLLNKIQD